MSYLEKFNFQSDRLFINAICSPISNFRALYGIKTEESDNYGFNKDISRLINDARYKVVQL